MSIAKRLKNYFFAPRYHYSRLQFNLAALIFAVFGFLFATYFATVKLPQIFATTTSSVSKDTDTHFSQGTQTSTSVSGSGTSAVVQLSGTAGPDGTQYKKSITIDNSTGSELTDYQISITLDTAALITAGKLQADCGDIRFRDSDDSTAISNYWVDKCNNTSTKIWVKVPSITASSTKTIYIYYGDNSAADGSNGPSTFEFFEGFDAALDTTTKWNSTGTEFTLSSNRLHYEFVTGQSSALRSISTFTRPFILEYDYFPTFPSGWTSPYHGTIHIGTFDTSNGAEHAFQPYGGGGASYLGHCDDGGCYHGNYLNPLVVGSSVEYDVQFKVKALVAGPQGVFDSSATRVDGGGSSSVSSTNVTTYASSGNDPLKVGFAKVQGSVGDIMEFDNFRVRKYTTTEPSTSVGTESIALPSSGTWESATDSNVIDTVWNMGWGDGTAGSTAFSATVANVGTNNTIAFAMRTAATTEALSSASYVTLGTVSTGTTFTKTKAELDALGIGTGLNRYVQVKATFAQTSGTNPQLDSFTINYLSDTDSPSTNSQSTAITGITSGSWTNTKPTITWSEGVDSESGILGSCVSLDEITATAATPTPTNSDPRTSSGILGTNGTYANCVYFVQGTSLNLTSFSLTTGKHYFFSIRAIDKAGNVYSGATNFQNVVNFKYDNTAPTNPSYFSLPGDFISTKSATLIWPITGDDAPIDGGSGVAGLQYRIGSSGTWYGDTHNGAQDTTDLLSNDGSYSTRVEWDFANIAEGSNLVYLRVWDTAGNVSSTYISGALKVNTTSPSAPRNLAVSSATSTTNSYSFTWDDPSSITGQASKLTFCYTVNTVPSVTSCNFTAADANSLAADAYATQPGENTLYLVAKDEAGNINYDTYTSVNFTYSGSAPGSPLNIDISDISIKSTSNWKLAVSWDPPTDLGAGISTYKIYRGTTNTTCSTAFSSFTYIGSTAGSSYSDTGLTQQNYYYCVKACDSANSCGAVSGTDTGYPDGKYTVAADLSSGPSASSITTKKATITWSTSRTADSKVQYGTSSGSYSSDEVSNSSQVTSHSVNLTNLKAGTTYYYKAKWTDEDGNTGTSEEKTFSTTSAPIAKNVSVTNISLTSALINYTVTNASSVKIYYGTTTSFGGSTTVSTSTSETSYTTQLTGLLDGTKYYYKINGFDSDGNEYEGTTLDFETLPRPKLTLVRLQEVQGTAQPTILVSWTSNTEVSSIVTFYPDGKESLARDEVNIALKKGEHTMVIKSLLPQTTYSLIVKGRDKVGNEASSDIQKFTTATDTRPPSTVNLKVEGTTTASSTGQEPQAQLVVSWDTDEPSSSQVEFGEGTGGTYAQKTQEDTNLTVNHLVIISNLTPSKVYHLRAISKDKAGNIGYSIDTVTITPKSSQSAFDLVIGNLSDAFGFLGK